MNYKEFVAYRRDIMKQYEKELDVVEARKEVIEDIEAFIEELAFNTYVAPKEEKTGFIYISAYCGDRIEVSITKDKLLIDYDRFYNWGITKNG